MVKTKHMKKTLFLLLGLMMIISVASAQREGRGGYHGGRYNGGYHSCIGRPYFTGPHIYIGPMFSHRYHKVWIEGYWSIDSFGNQIWINGYWRFIY